VAHDLITVCSDEEDLDGYYAIQVFFFCEYEIFIR